MSDFVLFDLDGTLTDPAEGITNSVAYALDKYGIEVADKSTLNVFIGPPLSESFRKYFKFSILQSVDAVTKYREYYHDRGIFENRLYEGIIELLATLKDAGKCVIMATSKPTVFAERIADHFDFRKYFDIIVGSELDGTRIDKAEVIKEALRQAGDPSPERCIMIGDRVHDVVGAKKTGLPCIGVLYGYGSREELEEAGADMIAETVNDLYGLIG